MSYWNEGCGYNDLKNTIKFSSELFASYSVYLDMSRYPVCKIWNVLLFNKHLFMVEYMNGLVNMDDNI